MSKNRQSPHAEYINNPLLPPTKKYKSSSEHDVNVGFSQSHSLSNPCQTPISPGLLHQLSLSRRGGVLHSTSSQDAAAQSSKPISHKMPFFVTNQRHSPTSAPLPSRTNTVAIPLLSSAVVPPASSAHNLSWSGSGMNHLDSFPPSFSSLSMTSVPSTKVSATTPSGTPTPTQSYQQQQPQQQQQQQQPPQYFHPFPPSYSSTSATSASSPFFSSMHQQHPNRFGSTTFPQTSQHSFHPPTHHPTHWSAPVLVSNSAPYFGFVSDSSHVHNTDNNNITPPLPTINSPFTMQSHNVPPNFVPQHLSPSPAMQLPSSNNNNNDNNNNINTNNIQSLFNSTNMTRMSISRFDSELVERQHQHQCLAEDMVFPSVKTISSDKTTISQNSICVAKSSNDGDIDYNDDDNNNDDDDDDDDDDTFQLHDKSKHKPQSKISRRRTPPLPPQLEPQQLSDHSQHSDIVWRSPRQASLSSRHRSSYATRSTDPGNALFRKSIRFPSRYSTTSSLQDDQEEFHSSPRRSSLSKPSIIHEDRALQQPQQQPQQQQPQQPSPQPQDESSLDQQSDDTDSKLPLNRVLHMARVARLAKRRKQEKSKQVRTVMLHQNAKLWRERRNGDEGEEEEEEEGGGDHDQYQGGDHQSGDHDQYQDVGDHQYDHEHDVIVDAEHNHEAPPEGGVVVDEGRFSS